MSIVFGKESVGLVAVADGWEYRVDLGDDSGVQVFKGKTEQGVIASLAKGFVNATRLIRMQRQEQKELIADQPVEVKRPKHLSLRAPTAEEQREIMQAFGDSTKAIKAFDEYMEIRFGCPIEQLVEKISAHDNYIEYQQSRNEAIAFMRDNPEFYQTPANNERLATYIEQQGWAPTKRNLQKAYAQLSIQGKLEVRSEEK